MKKLLVLSCLAGTVLFSSVPKAADFDRVYETGTPLKAPRMMPNFRELKLALKMPQFDLNLRNRRKFVGLQRKGDRFKRLGYLVPPLRRGDTGTDYSTEGP